MRSRAGCRRCLIRDRLRTPAWRQETQEPVGVRTGGWLLDTRVIGRLSSFSFSERHIHVVIASGTALLLGASDVLAQAPETLSDVSGQLAPLAVHLGRLLVVATILESALAIVFQWRVFRTLFNARAVKAPITVLAALVVVSTGPYDPFQDILKEARATTAVNGNWATCLMSAFILAGGTAGVNRLLRALGFRAASDDVSLPVPRSDEEAWISVTVRSGTSARLTKSVQVLIEPLPESSPQGSTLVAILDTRSRWRAAADAMLARSNRYPPSGGYVVRASQDYVISVHPDGSEPTELFKGRFAPRAVVDFHVNL